MIVEKVESHPLRSKLFKVYSNYMQSTIECNAPSDRHLFEDRDRKIELLVINSAFEVTVRVTFGQHEWNKRKLAPASSSSKHHIDPPKSSQ